MRPPSRPSRAAVRPASLLLVVHSLALLLLAVCSLSSVAAQSVYFPIVDTSCVYNVVNVSLVPLVSFTPATPALPLCDDCQTAVNLGFGFTFYGVTYGVVSVSSNGYGQQHNHCTLSRSDGLTPSYDVLLVTASPIAATLSLFCRAVCTLVSRFLSNLQFNSMSTTFTPGPFPAGNPQLVPFIAYFFQTCTPLVCTAITRTRRWASPHPAPSSCG